MRIIKRIFDNKGEGYIDLLVSISVILSVTYIFILIFPVFIAKQNVDYMAKSIVKTIEVTGENGKMLNDEIELLKQETGYAPNIKITGNFNNGKLQIRERFTVEVSYSVDIVIAKTLFGNELKFSIPVSKSLTGMSEVYYKN